VTRAAATVLQTATQLLAGRGLTVSPAAWLESRLFADVTECKLLHICRNSLLDFTRIERGNADLCPPESMTKKRICVSMKLA